MQCGWLAQVTRFASEEMEAPVVDETGVEGDWDIQFYWAPDKYPIRWPWAFDSPTGVDPSLPLFQAALEQQLGLTLKATPTTVDGVVIESARQPEGL
jgi:uncharacterized protein (TIGR03435 family)